MALLNFAWGRTLPSIMQTEKTECGLACIAMILNFYGHAIDLNTLRTKTSISQHGITLRTLMTLADRVQLSSRPLRLELADLAKLKLPAVLHWDMHHFVVLAAIRNNTFVIHDPASGVKKYTRDALSKHFTGIALELTPTEIFTSKVEERKLSITALWSKTTGLKQSLVQIVILALVMQGFALALPFYSQLVIDDVLVSYDIGLLKILALGFLLITLLNCATDFIRSYVVLHMSNSLGFQLAANVNRHLLALPLEYFSKRHMGDIVARFGSIYKIKDFITSGIIEVFIDGLMVIGTFVLILIYSFKLSLLATGILLINSIAKFALYGPLRRESEELLAASTLESTTFMENIRSIQGIKLFGKEIDRNAVWQNIYADVTNKGINVQKLNIYIRMSRSLIFGVENVLIVFMAGSLVIAGELSIGMMIAFLSYKEQLYKRFFGLIDKYFDFRMLDIHLCRLADIAHCKPEQLSTGPSLLPAPDTSTTFFEVKNLSFRYSDDCPYLFQNLDLRVRANESVAIIGPTGCGKSTLLRVILSLYPPTSGSLNLYDTPLKQLGLEYYRSNICGVLQDDSLLSGTIFDNISFFDPLPDRALVEFAAKQAAIAEDIARMPMRYETLVGNMGSALSGGQIQRVLLARTFYKQARLIILDEATSHLDLETEAAVNHAIKSMQSARIMVAHRPQSYMLADTIYRLTPAGLVRLDKAAMHANASVGTSVRSAV